MPANFAALRSNIELALAGRVVAPFTYRDRNSLLTVPTGIPEIDELTGGLPRGALTEIYGPACSGRTSLLFSALAARTAQGESCALIDACDTFDPHSAEAAGVDLKKLLWVRCKNIDQALRSTDLLLQSGGFGFIAADLTDVAPRLVRQVPLDSWFRFRRAVEDTPAILVLLDQESNAKTCASLVLRMDAQPACWIKTAPEQSANRAPLSVGLLLDGTVAQAAVSRSRMQRASGTHSHGNAGWADRSSTESVFRTKAKWDSSALTPGAAPPLRATSVSSPME